MWLVIAVVVAIGFVLVAALGFGREDPLPETLLNDPGPGYTFERDASGPLDIDAASTATPAKDEIVRSYLQAAGFEEGYARVWSQEEEFVTAAVFRFTSPAEARGLIELEFDQLERSVAARDFSVDGIPDARGFVLTGRVSDDTRFCTGVWYPVDERAYSIVNCGATPSGAQSAAALARRQWSEIQD